VITHSYHPNTVQWPPFEASPSWPDTDDESFFEGLACAGPTVTARAHASLLRPLRRTSTPNTNAEK
ncbi:unnamed protein product, partial [Laminaria digitata]